MTIALVLFAVAAVAAAGTVALRLISPLSSSVPTWLLWVNLAATVVTLVLIVAEVSTS